MPVRSATARWEGTLQDGHGAMHFGGAAFEGTYSVASRFEGGSGSNPEELIGAALAGCFSMALAGALGRAGHPAERIETGAEVHIDKGDAGWSITRIALTTHASVPGMDDATFQQHAETTRTGCPVAKALAGTEITLEAQLTA